MPTLPANGIDIYYELHGPHASARPELVEGRASPRPLVMTHGFAGLTENWRHEVLPLAAGRSLLLYDVRGHGRTSAPENPEAYSLPTFAADLAALVRALDIPRAHVGGVSMGGMIAAQFAVDYPDMTESLILIDTTAGNGLDDGPAGRWERQAAAGASALAHIALQYGLEETVRRQHEWARLYDPHLEASPYDPANDYERIKRITVAGYAGAALALAQRPDLTPRLADIRVPTLVMAGEWDDFLHCARRDHSLIPSSRLVVRRRCGHGTLWRYETFIGEVLSFLADVEAGRPVAGEREV